MKLLKKAVEDYINLRRKLGFKLVHDEYALHDFVSFLKRQHASYITTKLALQWALQRKNILPSHRAVLLGIVRRFAEYWSATDPRTEIPSRDLLPYRNKRITPYIYSNKEIVQLIEAAKKLKSPKGLRRWTHSTILGLLAVTGMRVRECVNLNNEEVDLKNGLLIIRRTKFNKSRLVPIHPSTQRVLRQYIHRRNRIFPKPKTPGFFVAETGMKLHYQGAYFMFTRHLSHSIVVRKSFNTRSPRLHDLRHTFVTQTLLRWYRTDVDVEQRLPYLSTFLGHGSVKETYWYFTAVPELLRLASTRLKQHMKGAYSS